LTKSAAKTAPFRPEANRLRHSPEKVWQALTDPAHLGVMAGMLGARNTFQLRDVF
jgi:uncharacterized protein YndB with AHSA1/START domain